LNSFGAERRPEQLGRRSTKLIQFQKYLRLKISCRSRAREVDEFSVLSFAMERNKEWIADEAGMAIEVNIDCLAHETVWG